MYVHSRVDYNTFTMDIGLPYIALTLLHARVDFSPQVRDFGFGLNKQFARPSQAYTHPAKPEKCINCAMCSYQHQIK